jgi:hypothetical protein
LEIKIKIFLLLVLVVFLTFFINNELIKALPNQEKVSVGRQHSLALKRDGTVWAWGENSSGQLGINNTINQHIPIQVTGEGGVSGRRQF